MADIHDEVKDKLRRSLKQEFIRQEDDFDVTRVARNEIVTKLMQTVRGMDLCDNKEGVLVPHEDTSTRLSVVTTALKALADTEKANSSAIALKLRQQEVDAASAAAHKDRLLAVIQATAPGAIVGAFPAEDMDQHLEEMFGNDIQDFELKTSARDLSDE